MRPSNLVLSAALVLCAPVHAQTVPEGSNWQRVQALPAGTTVHVKANNTSTSCTLKAVDADSLTCTRVKDLTFQRAEIRSIRISHRVRSTLIGAGVGAGVGVVVGIGVNASLGGFGTRKTRAAGAGAAIFTPLGLIIGASTDFSRDTVYRTH